MGDHAQLRQPVELELASIRKRDWGSGGTQKSAWVVDYKDSAGTRRSKQFGRKKDASDWLTKTAFNVAQGTHTADSQSESFSSAATRWLARPDSLHLEPTTRAAYEQQVRLHIVPECGSLKLSQITTPQVERLRDVWVSKLSRPMALRVLRTFKAILTEAQRLGTIAFNPAAAVKLKRLARAEVKVVIPSPTQLRMLMGVASQSCSHSASALLSVLIFTGVRASELRGLAWSNIDFVAQQIRISRRADDKGSLGPPKSKSGNRAIPVSTLTLDALKTWKLQCPHSADDLVFPSDKGTVIPYPQLRAIVDNIQRAAGMCAIIDEGRPAKAFFGLHAFRHAAASLWIEQGENPKRIQSMMGHSSIQVTFDIYGHLFHNAARDAATADAMTRAVLDAA